MLAELDPNYLRLREEARAVAAEAERWAVEADRLSTPHPELLGLLRASGLAQVVVPARYGGRDPDVDPLAVCVVREVLMGTSAQLDSLFALQGIGSYGIASAGTEEQKQRWLPGVAALDSIAALALTEPEAGSDLKAITTTLESTAGGLRLRGRKAFISNGGVAAFYTTLAREGDGYSLVIVPADAPGLSVVPTPELIAPHILGDIAFDGVELEPAARLGAAHEGFAVVLATLAVFRVSVASAAVGLAQAALDEATRHATTRSQFGRPLARHGAVAGMLAESWTEIEMARLLTYRAAERARADAAGALGYSSMAKLAASEMAGRVVDRCVQVMGRFGLVHDSKIERLYRQARPMRIYEGSSEVLKLQIARALTQREQ